MININKLSVEINNKELVSEFDAKLNTGEFWAILGKNGTGKTTLLHTLAGFTDYNSGSIQVNHKDLASFSSLYRAQNIAFLSQLMESGLDCTVEQSVSYGRYPWHLLKLDGQTEQSAINAAIDAMQLQKLRFQNIRKISGGELRKVEIATILAQDSEIMMLDEPLNHLDITFRYKLMELLKKLSHKKLIIIVTHEIQYVQTYCSHVIMLMENGGTIIGKTKEVLNHKNLEKMLGIDLPNKFINETF